MVMMTMMSILTSPLPLLPTLSIHILHTFHLHLLPSLSHYTLIIIIIYSCLTALPDQGFCNVEIKKTKGSRPAAITSRERNAGSESSPVKNSKNLDDIELLQFKCPYHTCWTCSEWHDAQPSNYRKKVKGGGFKNTELFKCIACPKAFHMKCIPPASRHNRYSDTPCDIIIMMKRGMCFG